MIFAVRCLLYLIFVLTAAALSGCALFSAQKSNRSLAYRSTTTLSSPVVRIGEPFGIVLRDDDIFVSDGEAGTIVRMNAAGEATVLVQGLNTPSGLALAPDGDLIVADTGSHTIKKVDANGIATKLAGIENTSGSADGPADVATFNGPIGVAVTANGSIYVSDTYNDRIRVIRDGSVSTLAGTSRGFADGASSGAAFDTPLGIAVWNDRLLVADSGNRRLRVVEENGAVWTVAGSGDVDLRDGLPVRAAFVMPTAVAVGANGQIIVADGNAIRVIGRRPFPFVETISNEDRCYADGNSLQARFNRPSGIAIGDAGQLLIADSDNQVVRAISDGGVGHEADRSEIDARRTSAEEFRSSQPPRWPYDPPTNPREVAGTLGEIRGEISDRDRSVWFHNGLDIAGAYGEITRFIRTETVLDPHAVENFGTARELLRMPTIGYIHLRLGRNSGETTFGDARFQFQYDAVGKLNGLRVPRGTKFNAGDAIGTLNAMNHVHLVAGRSGREINALAALSFPGIGDSIPPVIETVSLYDQNWSRLEPQAGDRAIKLSDNTRIVVKAYDRMDGNSERRRLGVYRVGYQLMSVGEIQWTIRFDRSPSNDVVRYAYGDGSRSGYTPDTIFNYIATNRVDGDEAREDFLDSSQLAPGRYTLQVFAEDYFGNVTSKDVQVVK